VASNATVNLPLAEYNALCGRMADLENQVAQLTRDLTAAKVADPSGQVPLLLRTINTALPIVLFATGNLDPATVRGWPYKEVSALADLLVQVPGLTLADPGAALTDLRTFAREAAGVEQERRRRSGE